jgi:hypothetical protein
MLILSTSFTYFYKFNYVSITNVFNSEVVSRLTGCINPVFMKDIKVGSNYWVSVQF